MKNRKLVIVGIGELLWELSPDGKKLGGTPVEFTYYGKNLGAEAFLVSAVGNDSFGKEVIENLNNLGVDTKYLQVSNTHRTGILSYTLDDNGNTSYMADENSAWENIEWNSELKNLASKADIICFSTLVLRSKSLSELLSKFLNSAKSTCLKLFDINFRLNGFSEKSLINSLKLSDIVKLNKNELGLISEMLAIKGTEDSLLNEIMGTYDLQLLAMTQGKKESIVLNRNDKSKKATVEVINHNSGSKSLTAVLACDYIKKLNLAPQKKWL